MPTINLIYSYLCYSGSYFAYESEDSSVLRKGQMEYIQKGPSMLNTRVKNVMLDFTFHIHIVSSNFIF